MPYSHQMYYFAHRAGDATHPPIVLIHGAGGNAFVWPTEVRRLPDFDVYAPDLPAHGKSQGTPSQSIEGYAHSILQWLESLHIPRAVFVGHSMGGAIALSLAIHHPETVLGLGLLATGARLKVAPALLENTQRAESLPLVLNALEEWAFGPHADKTLVTSAMRRIAATRPAVLHADFLACDRFQCREHLADIHCPTLVMCGDADRMTPLRLSQFLADEIPQARLHVLPETGHMLMLEQPRAVAEALHQFATAVPFRPGR
ncbi:MAG: alpha/beta fold hydrolase [Anaerolineae bacterium]|nr:MAG: alpha/beta fold hydrolase [Anaerolineae bacterium]